MSSAQGFTVHDRPDTPAPGTTPRSFRDPLAEGTPIDIAHKEFEIGVQNTPAVETDSEEQIIAWVVFVFRLLYVFLNLRFKNVYDYLKRLEENIREVEENIDGIKINIADVEAAADRARAASSQPQATTSAPAPTTVPAGPSRPTHPPSTRRCTKCHARGHSTEECRTTNPAAMRKRIAENARRKKLAAPPTFYPSPYVPAPPPPTYGHYPSPAPDPIAAYAFIADATELRRRRQQSDRDKRRIPRSTT